MQNLSFGNPPANEYAESITRSLTNAAFSSEIVMACECGLTKKAEPPPTRGVNRDSGTASANGGWLRRLVRPQVSWNVLASHGDNSGLVLKQAPRCMKHTNNHLARLAEREMSKWPMKGQPTKNQSS